MGSEGRTGFVRLIMGSVAEKVIREVPCTVLTVKNKAAQL
jgi:nucleotide-binding universal stress UspA family protein